MMPGPSGFHLICMCSYGQFDDCVGTIVIQTKEVVVIFLPGVSDVRRPNPVEYDGDFEMSLRHEMLVTSFFPA